MKHFPELNAIVPPVTLIFPEERSDSAQENARVKQQRVNSEQIDIRLPIVHEFLRSSNLEANSRRLYERELKQFMAWADVPFGSVTASLLGRYRAYLEQERRTQKGTPLSRNSINAAITALKSFFGWLHLTHSHQCPNNPAASVKWLKTTLSTPQDLSQAALSWIWATLPRLGESRDRDELLIHLLIHGLRASEVVDLSIASFDGDAVFLAETKTHQSRLVPLSQSSLKLMRRYLTWRREALEDSLSPEAPLVVSLHPGYRGKRISYGGIYAAVERIAQQGRQLCLLEWIKAEEERAIALVPQLREAIEQLLRCDLEGGWDEAAEVELVPQLPDEIRRVLEELQGVHPHQFRHTYATQLLLTLGMTPEAARKLTGHQSQAAFQRYAMRAEQQAAMNAFRAAEGTGKSLVPDASDLG
jgi:integrase/recombinase XerD